MPTGCGLLPHWTGADLAPLLGNGRTAATAGPHEARYYATFDEVVMLSGYLEVRPDVADLPQISRLSFSKQTVTRQDFRHRLINDMNALGATFNDCNFSYSIFHRAYFRDAKFTNCQFVGCQFNDSNLKHVRLLACDLRYIRFFRSQLDAEEILAALPLEPNIRREAVQNLRANATSIGDFSSQRLLVLQEVAAAQDHYRRALRGADTYYRQKYASIFAKMQAGWRLLGLRVGGFVWGHGERPARILLSGTVILFLLTFINFWSVMPRVGWSETAGGLRVLEYVISVFLGAPHDQTFHGFFIIDYLAIVLRYIYVGLFISVLFRTISHR
jgi:hypothetical protein